MKIDTDPSGVARRNHLMTQEHDAELMLAAFFLFIGSCARYLSPLLCGATNAASTMCSIFHFLTPPADQRPSIALADGMQYSFLPFSWISHRRQPTGRHSSWPGMPAFIGK